MLRLERGKKHLEGLIHKFFDIVISIVQTPVIGDAARDTENQAGKGFSRNICTQLVFLLTFADGITNQSEKSTVFGDKEGSSRIQLVFVDLLNEFQALGFGYAGME